jgi:hypothetical protein
MELAGIGLLVLSAAAFIAVIVLGPPAILAWGAVQVAKLIAN